jgi:hypothetical protein
MIYFDRAAELANHLRAQKTQPLTQRKEMLSYSSSLQQGMPGIALIFLKKLLEFSREVTRGRMEVGQHW